MRPAGAERALIGMDVLGFDRVRRTLWVACAALLLSSLSAAGQSAPDRFAFIVGNNAYERRANGDIIENSRFNLFTPRNDAVRYAEVMERLGWEVLNESLADRSNTSLQNDLDAAAKQITAGSEVVFIFNGHGFSENGKNYLVGVPDDGERYNTIADMRAGSIDLEGVIDRLSLAGPSRIILLINACGDEPLVSDASIAPAKPNFDNTVSEILVLYSSSPRGIAYDYIDNDETQNIVRNTESDRTDLSLDAEESDLLLSVFGRVFIPQMEENRPLLNIFTDARLDVERLSARAASSRDLPNRQGLQIPHVLFDTINGQFNLADVSKTAVDSARFADWRIYPPACRFNVEDRQEALQLRSEGRLGSSAEGRSIQACLLAAALGDLGIEKLAFDSDRNGVVVALSGPDSPFRNGDLIQMANVKPAGERRERFNFRSLDVFGDMLAQHYFVEGSNITFAWRRSDGSLPASGFESRNF